MKNIIIYGSILIMAIQAVYGQKKAAQDTAFNQKIVLEREFNPIFRDASRIELLPSISDPKAEKTAILYQYSKLDIKFPLQWKTMPPEKKLDQFDYQSQRAFVNLGVGLPANTLLNGEFEILNDETNHLDVTVDHRSIDDKREVGPSNEKQNIYSSDSKLAFNYSRPFTLFTMEATAAYTHSEFNYFGTGAAAGNNTNTTNQVNNVLNLASLFKSTIDGDISYKGGFSYNYFAKGKGATKDLNGANEHHVQINGNITKKLNDKKLIGVDFSLNNFIYSNDSNNVITDLKPENGGYLTFKPYYNLEGENYRISAGLKGELGFFSKMSVRLAPALSGIWEFTPHFYALGSIGGGTNINSFAESDSRYRYLHPSVRLKDTFTPLDALFSVKSNVIPRLEVELSAGFKSGDEYYFASKEIFFTNYLLPTAITNTKQYSVSIQGKYEWKDLGDLQLRMSKYSYRLKEFNPGVNDQNIAWDKPDFELALDANVRINDRINAQLAYYLATGRYGLEEIAGGYHSVGMKPIHQLNLNGRYKINKSWSAFCQLNNILLQKYDLWLGMPAQNFNFVIGAGFSY